MTMQLSTAELFGKSEYSDATIYIYGVKLPVHKIVLCTQCPEMKLLFSETAYSEKPNVLTFEEGSGAAHWRLIEFIYTGDYSDEMPDGLNDDHMLLKDFRVYKLANEFSLDIGTLCTSKLEERLNNAWLSYEFLECVHEVYEYTSDGNDPLRLRHILVEVARRNARELIGEDPFKRLIREGGDFAVDFLESIILADTTTSPGSSLSCTDRTWPYIHRALDEDIA